MADFPRLPGWRAKSIFAAISISALAITLARAEPSCDPSSVIRNLFTDTTVAKTINIIPHEVKFEPLTSKMLNRIKHDKKTYTYFVDSYGVGHYSPKPFEIPGESDFFLIKAPGSNESHIIRETGTLSWDSTTNKLEQKVAKAWDLTEEESKAILQELKKVSPEIPIKKLETEHRQFARDISCAETHLLVEGKKNLINDMTSSTLGTGAVLLTFTAMGEKVFTDPAKQAKTFGDILQAPASVLANYPFKQFFRKKNVLLDYSARNFVASPIVAGLVKQPIYYGTGKLFNNKKAAETNREQPRKIFWYDTSYGMLQYFPKRTLENYVQDNLPAALAEVCSKHPDRRIIFGPKMIRSVDKYTWAMVYYVGRDKLGGLDAADAIGDQYDRHIDPTVKKYLKDPVQKNIIEPIQKNVIEPFKK